MTATVHITPETIVGEFVLPDDVDLRPVRDLDPRVRRRINASAGDYTVVRPHSRMNAKLVDSGTALLLQQFRSPTTIVEAVIRRSRETGEQPESALIAAHPVLISLIRSRLLVSAVEARHEEIAPRYRPGDHVCGCVIRYVLQVLSDTELYVAYRASAEGESVVLKLARVPAEESLASLAHEAKVLDHLGGDVSPALIEAGTIDGRDYVLMERRRGVGADRAAANLRATRAQSARADLARLAANIADAYARLHRRTVVHGDVHERNVLVDRDATVTLLDFGLSRFADSRESASVRRGGHSFFYEPEFARASIEGKLFPPASIKSDQYSLGAMLYQLLTGSSYIEFELDEPRAFSQIVNAPMMRFEQRGVAPWPAMEAAFSRALAKDPADRFETMDAFAQAIRDAGTSDAHAVAVRKRRRDRRSQFSSATLARLSQPAASVELLSPPTASVTFGAAGIALAFYELAQLGDDAALLSVADRWCQAARAERRRPRAFYDGEDLARGTFGHRAFFYGASGIDVIEALVASAMGDFVTVRDSTRRLATLPANAGSPVDCVLGVPGTLIGLCHLLEAIPDHELFDRKSVLKAGSACARAIIDALARRRPIAEERRFVNLGIAHGWGGCLYALMRWHRASGTPLPALVHRRLDELAALAEPTDRGVRWPWRDTIGDAAADKFYMPGWCNGSAGFVHLWLLANAIFGDVSYLELAEGAAWDAYDDGEDTVYDLCCGRAGRAYALVAFHRATGEDVWLSRARKLSDDALTLVAKANEPRLGLIKGAMGVVLLHAQLEQPNRARMPVFEAAGWPSRTNGG